MHCVQGQLDCDLKFQSAQVQLHLSSTLGSFHFSDPIMRSTTYLYQSKNVKVQVDKCTGVLWPEGVFRPLNTVQSYLLVSYRLLCFPVIHSSKRKGFPSIAMLRWEAINCSLDNFHLWGSKQAVYKQHKAPKLRRNSPQAPAHGGDSQLGAVLQKRAYWS